MPAPEGLDGELVGLGERIERLYTRTQEFLNTCPPGSSTERVQSYAESGEIVRSLHDLMLSQARILASLEERISAIEGRSSANEGRRR